jgi:hypothetical protein
MEASSLAELADDLLLEAAIFVARDQGSPGFLSRFTETVSADAELASRALDRALAARARVGKASFSLGPGDLRVETTSTGGRLTACALAGADGRVTASLRVEDAESHPVAGAALRVQARSAERIAVTNAGGWVNVSEAGDTLRILLGGSDMAKQESFASTGSDADGEDLVTLPRNLRNAYELAAAHTSREQMPDTPLRWRVRARGVDFLCQERTSGEYDLTLLVAGVTAEFADRSAGLNGVSFAAWGRHRRLQSWIVPLAPRPLGLGGSLYGTDVDRLNRRSVHIGRTEELLRSGEDHIDEIIHRSIWHSDAGSAWTAVCDRLEPGELRTAVEAALAERESAL